MKRFLLVLCGLLGLARLQGAEAQSASVAAPPAAAGTADLSMPRQPARTDEPEGRRLTLQSFARMIATADEMVLAQRLEENVAEEGVRGAKAIFEPFMFVALEREGMNVLSSAQEAQMRGIQPQDVFSSHESRLKTGVSVKTPLGTDVELSYNANVLRDSIQPDKLPAISPEYKGYLGFKISQPLLRGAGPEPTRAGITIAEIEKGVARETVRQVMAQRVMEGVQAYIFVQRAEERVRLRQKALETAIQFEHEMSRQQSAGLRSSTELTEARSSLALRRAQLAQAQQELEEQHSALQVFVSAREREAGSPLAGSLLRPADPLEVTAAKGKPVVPGVAAAEDLDGVLTRRPEARVNSIRIEREAQRLEVARDQTLPDLSLNLRLGKEDLSASWRPLVQYGGGVPHHSYQVSLIFKVGLFNDEKKDSEYRSAVYRRDQARLALGAVRQRIANELQASGFLLEKAQQQVARQKEIVDAQRSLLRVESELVREGRRSLLDVLKKQLEVLMAEEALADSVAQFNRVSYLNSQVDGSLLSRLDLE